MGWGSFKERKEEKKKKPKTTFTGKKRISQRVSHHVFVSSFLNEVKHELTLHSPVGFPIALPAQ